MGNLALFLGIIIVIIIAITSFLVFALCIASGKNNHDTTDHDIYISNIKVMKLKYNAVIPQKGSKYSAGVDLSACIDEPIRIHPHTTEKIGTGLAIEVPKGFFGAIFARSGLSTKEGLRPANCVGVCDSDYRGEYIIPVHNDSDRTKVINPGDRIAQLIILPYVAINFKEVNELSDTSRGIGGFGSTGK